MAFCGEIAVARMHVFPYSERTGTPAADMPGSVPVHVREARARQLIALGHEMADAYRYSQLGSVRNVLFETCDGALSVGYTPEYMRCEAPGVLCGQTLPVRLTGLASEGFIGEVVK